MARFPENGCDVWWLARARSLPTARVRCRSGVRCLNVRIRRTSARANRKPPDLPRIAAAAIYGRERSGRAGLSNLLRELSWTGGPRRWSVAVQLRQSPPDLTQLGFSQRRRLSQRAACAHHRWPRCRCAWYPRDAGMGRCVHGFARPTDPGAGQRTDKVRSQVRGGPSGAAGPIDIEPQDSCIRLLLLIVVAFAMAMAHTKSGDLHQRAFTGGSVDVPVLQGHVHPSPDAVKMNPDGSAVVSRSDAKRMQPSD